MNSNLFKLNWKDAGKAILVAFLTALITTLIPILEVGALPSRAQLVQAAIAGLTAALAYLLKNFLTNSEGQVAKSEK